MKDAKGHGSDPRGGSDPRLVDANLRPAVNAWNAKNARALAASGVASHSSGVQQIGQTPFNRGAVMRAFNRNENNNAHSENVALLTQHFGTPAEHAMAKEIIAERDRIGQLPDRTKSVPNVREFQYSMNKNYYPLLIGNRARKS